MTIRALLLLGGVSLALASVASAQSPASPPPAVDPPATQPAMPPPPAAATAPHVPTALNQPGLPPQRIHAIVRASGFDPVGRPVPHGNLYVQRAIDPNGVAYRLVVDSVTGRTVSVRPAGIAGPYAEASGYGPYGPPPYRPAYGRYYGPPPEYGFGYGSPRPPRAVPTARLAPPPQQPQQPQPQLNSQPQPSPSTSAQAPLPRPKPYVMEATGSIPVNSPQSLSKTAERAAEPPKAASEPPKAAPEQNGAAAMPPVAPLD